MTCYDLSGRYMEEEVKDYIKEFEKVVDDMAKENTYKAILAAVGGGAKDNLKKLYGEDSILATQAETI